MALTSDQSTIVSGPYAQRDVQQIVEEIVNAFDEANENALKALDAATAFINALANAVDDVAPPVITPVFPTVPSAPSLAWADRPTLKETSVSFPDQPDIPSSDIDLLQYLPETFDENPPELVVGPAPTFTATPPPAPGVDLDLVVPEFAGITLPSAPNLLTLNIRQFDGITIPDFTEEVSEFTAIAPSVVPYIPGADYTSTLLTALQTSLEDRIVNGGTGLPPDVEQAIWDRGREREALATRDALLELDQFEARGFALPPGAYADQHLKITTEMHARTVSISREIMIEQARLELENIKMALAQATTLEGQLMNLYNQTEQRAFDAVRYATQAAIDVYNAKVQAYGIFLQAYSAKVEIYKAQVQGELSKVEAYKAEVQAEQAKAQVNVALVDSYNALIRAALANVEVFKAEVEAILAKASIEKAKIDVFGAEVQAFSSQANAYAAHVQGYRGTIEAETAKQEAFRSKVQAYSAEAQALAAASQSAATAYRADIEGKMLVWEGYKAASQAAAEKAKVIAAENSALIDAYRGEVASTVGYNQVLTAQWEAAIRQINSVTEIGVSAAKANAELFLSARSLSLDAAKVGAQVSAQLAASAMNAVSYSLSGQGQASLSHSTGEYLNKSLNLTE